MKLSQEEVELLYKAVTMYAGSHDLKLIGALEASNELPDRLIPNAKRALTVAQNKVRGMGRLDLVREMSTLEGRLGGGRADQMRRPASKS